VQLAAEFGSRVQVEKTCLDDNGILVTGGILAAATVLPPPLAGDRHLPPSIPGAGEGSLLQAITPGLVSPVLPAALSEVQQAIAPVRASRRGCPCLTAVCFTAATALRCWLWVHWHGSTT